MSLIKRYLFLLCMLSSGFVNAQEDSAIVHGSIKIAKPISIQASALFSYYERSGKESKMMRANIHQPSPYSPEDSRWKERFDHTFFFKESFAGTTVDLKGKERDTVKIVIKVSYDGDCFIELRNSEETVSDLDLLCLDYIKAVKRWYPAFYEPYKGLSRRDRKLSAAGVITVVFSSLPSDQ